MRYLTKDSRDLWRVVAFLMPSNSIKLLFYLHLSSLPTPEINGSLFLQCWLLRFLARSPHHPCRGEKKDATPGRNERLARKSQWILPTSFKPQVYKTGSSSQLFVNCRSIFIKKGGIIDAAKNLGHQRWSWRFNYCIIRFVTRWPRIFSWIEKSNVVNKFSRAKFERVKSSGPSA